MKLTQTIKSVLLLTGSIGLLGAMTADGLGVLGRQFSIPFAGAIELAEVCVIIAASSALAYATLVKGHASVDILVRNLSLNWQHTLGRITSLLSALFVGVFLVGSIWILLETWFEGERTEVLSLEIRWFRIIWIACAAFTTLRFAYRIFKRESDSAS